MSEIYEPIIPGDWLKLEAVINRIWRELERRKIPADSITQGNGGHGASALSDLQTAHDGNFYHIDETGTDPGFELTVDFVSVDEFRWVNCYASYNGGSHCVNISLYNWDTSAWDCFDAFAPSSPETSTPDEYTIQNHDFLVFDDRPYIGKGINQGKVRVKIAHESSGNAAHDFDVDVVALYT